MSTVELLTFSMRTEPPKQGEDWFRIVEAKKASEPTKVYIYDEIGYWGTTAKDFAALFNDIDSKEIHVHINSPGGSVFDGLAIGAAIRDHKATVTGKVDGMAASAASFILQYCDARECSRNAQVMIHDAKAYAGGNAEQMRKAADLLDRVSDSVADIYAVRSGQGTKESWRETMKSGDTWYDGNEAVTAGLVDEVIDNPAEEEEPENEWSMEDVQAFVSLPAAQLAQDAKRSVITNRVEEAHMTGEAPNTPKAPPTPPQPPAPAVPTQPTTSEAAVVTLMVNGAEVTDVVAVQAHITALETFKKETVDGARKDFVAKLAADKKILASNEGLTQTEEFALSLSDEQFRKWKASMDAAPAQSLLGQHGVEPGQRQAPEAPEAKAKADDIEVLEEIVQAHRDTGMSEEILAKKESYIKLQQLKQASAS